MRLRVFVALLLALLTTDAQAQTGNAFTSGASGGSGFSGANAALATRIAEWDITKVRYYLLDYDGGSDSNVCYVDATAGSTIVPTGKACKTIEHFFQVFPRNGNGRTAVVMLKLRAAGATYKKIDGTTDDSLDFTGVLGYRIGGLIIRGSTDLTNSVHDRLALGALTAVTGPNGDGSFTVTTGGTTSVFSIASGSLGSADTAVGWRTRFDPATSTSTLRDVSGFISINSTTQVTTAANLAAAPANGDTFFLERPGVRVGSFVGSPPQPIVLAGIGIAGSASSSMSVSTGTYTFIELTASTTNATFVGLSQTAGSITLQSGYTDEAVTFRSTAHAMRTSGAISSSTNSGTMTITPMAAMNAAAAVLFTSQTPSICTGGGCYFALGPTLRDVSGDTGLFGPSTVTSNRNVRVLGGPVTLNGWAWQVRNVDISNSSGAGILINASARQGTVVFLQTVTGTGNAGAGLDLAQFARNALVGAASDTTITGSLGDWRVSGPAVGAWTDLTLTNVVDNVGTRLYGQSAFGEHYVSQGVLVSNQSGGALAVGDIVRTNGTTNQVTSALADTNAHATGVTGVMVTAPASAALGYMVTTGVPYVRFAATPTAGALYYLSAATAGRGTTTVPAQASTNQKLRLGYVVTVSGSHGYAMWRPELIPVTSDGAAP